MQNDKTVARVENYNLRNKGITLIALIITIIILLILVAVSIDLIVDGKLFDSAGDAVSKTNEKVEQQQGRVNELMGELEKVEQSQCTHTWGDWKTTKEATEAEKGIKTRKCTKCGKTETAETPINAVIGAKIDYHEYIGEDGNPFTTMPSYTSTGEKTGNSYGMGTDDQVFTVANNSGVEWIILGEEDGQIKITTKNVILPNDTTGYGLYDKAGWTNYISELHEIGAIYGKGKYADTNKFNVTVGGKTGGRSFIMEDLGYGELTRPELCIYEMHDDGKVYKKDDTSSTSTNDSSKFEYLEMDANTITKEEGKVWKELKTSANGGPTSVTIYDYFYSGSKTLDTSVSKSNSEYWLASRALDSSSHYLLFGLRVVDSNGNASTPYYMFLSTGSPTTGGRSCGVRPVVYLKPDIQLSYNASTGYTIK